MEKKKNKIVLWRKDIPWYKNFYMQPVIMNGYLVVAFILFMAWAYQADVQEYQDVVENPCAYCNVQALCTMNNLGGDLSNRNNFMNESTFVYSLNQSLTEGNIISE